MKIAAVLGVKDEIELIRPAIAHLRAIGVDHIIASDAGSKDGSAEVLAEEARGKAFELMFFDDTVYDGGEAEERSTAEAMKRAERVDADWVLFCDADEFWLPATGHLKHTRALAQAEVLSVARFNEPLLPAGVAIPFPALPVTYSDVLLYAPEEGQKATQARVRQDPDAPWIAAIPAEKVMLRPDKVASTGPGHHTAVALAGREIAVARPQDLVIAHVPFTTEARFARKVANIAAAVAASGHEWSSTSAWHWRRWLQTREREGGIADEIARNTVLDSEIEALRQAGLVKSAAELLARGGF